MTYIFITYKLSYILTYYLHTNYILVVCATYNLQTAYNAYIQFTYSLHKGYVQAAFQVFFVDVNTAVFQTHDFMQTVPPCISAAVIAVVRYEPT
jgi:hypothetical protein